MELIFELIFQFLGEVILQAVFEILVEFGFHSLADTIKRPRSVWLSLLGFFLWGLVAGGLSLLIFPAYAITDPTLRIANLVLTPLFLGAVMMMIGRLRQKRGQDLVKLDRFGYAAILLSA